MATDKGFSEYRIQKGDSLSKIAKQFGIKDYRALAELNGIKNADLIMAGAVLKIPTAAAAITPEPAISTLEPLTVNAPKPGEPEPAAMPLEMPEPVSARAGLFDGNIAATPAAPASVTPPKTIPEAKPTTSEIQALRDALVKSALAEVGTLEAGKDNVGPKLNTYREGTGTGDGAAWCAAFASYKANQVQPGLVNPTAVAGGLLAQFNKADAYHSAKSDYVPQPGDMIFFNRSNPNDPSTHWQRHTGFVVQVDSDGTIHTVEGNKLDPELRGKSNIAWSPDKPDGVFAVKYTPEQLAQERYLGAGNIEELVNHLVDHKGLRIAASVTNPTESNIVAATDRGPSSNVMSGANIAAVLGIFPR